MGYSFAHYPPRHAALGAHLQLYIQKAVFLLAKTKSVLWNTWPYCEPYFPECVCSWSHEEPYTMHVNIMQAFLALNLIKVCWCAGHLGDFQLLVFQKAV